MCFSINVIFPMAGDGVRFGGKDFKPFIDGTEKLFIELAKEPFDILKYNGYNPEFYFIYRQDQEDKYNVSSRLKKLFPSDTLHFCILPNETKGPAETISNAVSMYNLSGSFFICDCDHAIQIDPLVEHLKSNTPDIIVPLWSIKESESHLFAKVKISNTTVEYYEKEIIPFSAEYSVKGIIGCYYFKDISVFKEYDQYTNISDILPLLSKTSNISHIDIQNAGFFGTPESLISYRFQLAKKMTFFIDIDGTILYLPKHVSYDSNDADLLPGVLDKLRLWKSQGHAIVLTTGRVHERREKLIKLLEELKVPYDQLVTNLRPGPRVLINDKKPYSEIHKMAVAFQLQRNTGLGNITVEDTPTILKKLKGGSFANTYLIEKDKKIIVRKYIEKTVQLKPHVDTLKRQYDDMKRLSYYSPDLVPKIYESGENESEFFYDMEYLEGYDELSHFAIEIKKNVILRTLQKLQLDVYCYSKQVSGKEWLDSFILEKIISKYTYIQSIDDLFYKLVNNEYITINDKCIKGLKYTFSSIKNTAIYPTEVSPIHGDLTLENILYNQTTDKFRVIDTSGSRYVDIKEMDLAKLLQSLLANYEVWSNSTELPYKELNSTVFIINNIYTTVEYNNFKYIFHSEEQFQRSVFILGTYFIRMIPFLQKISTKHATFGLLLGLFYTNMYT